MDRTNNAVYPLTAMDQTYIRHYNELHLKTNTVRSWDLQLTGAIA